MTSQPYLPPQNEPILLQSFIPGKESEIEYQIMAYSSLDFLEAKCETNNIGSLLKIFSEAEIQANKERIRQEAFEGRFRFLFR